MPGGGEGSSVYRKNIRRRRSFFRYDQNLHQPLLTQINLLYQNLLRKREELKRLEAQGKHKYEYDSDEETEGGTWEHKLRSAEMEATQMWAEELTAQAEGKHHIGDFLPPDELDKFMEQYNAVKEGREPNLGDYKEYKLKEDNIGAFNKNLTTRYTSLGEAPFYK